MKNKKYKELEYVLKEVAEQLGYEPNEVAEKLEYDGRAQGGSGKTCTRAQKGSGKNLNTRPMMSQNTSNTRIGFVLAFEELRCAVTNGCAQRRGKPQPTYARRFVSTRPGHLSGKLPLGSECCCATLHPEPRSWPYLTGPML